MRWGERERGRTKRLGLVCSQSVIQRSRQRNAPSIQLDDDYIQYLMIKHSIHDYMNYLLCIVIPELFVLGLM